MPDGFDDLHARDLRQLGHDQVAVVLHAPRAATPTSSCGPEHRPFRASWHRLDVHEVVCDCSVAIAEMMSWLAIAQPIRNPVIPYVFAMPLTTIRLLALVSRVENS